MMKWEDFYPYVLPHVIGCPNPTLDQHIRQAAIEFCRRTLCYTRTLDSINTDGISTQFELDFPNQTQPVKIMAVAVNGRDYTLVDTQRGLQLVRQGSVADFAFTTNKISIDIHPLQLSGLAVDVDVALTPTFTSTLLDDEIAFPYAQDIAHGAVRSLQMIPGQDWSNPNMAVANKTLFNQRIGAVAMQISRGQAAAKLRNFKTYF